mmetsp:Transcript_7422/g.16205  ORF Transcript_7422/g.16205 Transcript_7422/m.16205 type:complete len:234 (+) Transcript_7422:861-1562(+)
MSHASFIKYFVGKLSLPSTTTSHGIASEYPSPIILIAVSEVSSSLYVLTLTRGLMSLIRRSAESHFDTPTVDVPCMICLCKFDSSTVSASTMPMRPTPAAARYRRQGLPSPPAPTTRTLAFLSAFCPATPTSPRTRWREYRDISALLNSSADAWSFVGRRPLMIAWFGRRFARRETSKSMPKRGVFDVEPSMMNEGVRGAAFESDARNATQRVPALKNISCLFIVMEVEGECD